ncbi:hypothetical protein J6590_069629 [Homalodisca vitripennis]|nr:hypothetical protein J6590_069629 [Homalodisca vitripennis]
MRQGKVPGLEMCLALARGTKGRQPLNVRVRRPPTGPKDIEVDSKQELFEALKNQSDLDTDQWTAVGGKSSTNGEFLVLHVDEDSLKKLKTLAIRPFLGSDRITFKLKGDKPTTQQSSYGNTLPEDPD